MNLCLFLLASLASATSILPSSGMHSNASAMRSSPLDVAYRCAVPAQPIAGRRSPSALDCLNVMTYILATTPNHNQPTAWSRAPGSDHVNLPYRRNSGTCQLLVKLTGVAPPPTEATATFDQVIAASMRIIEVCLLGAKPDSEPAGGVALAGIDGMLDVVVWGSRTIAGEADMLGNTTDALDGTGPWFDPVSQS